MPVTMEPMAPRTGPWLVVVLSLLSAPGAVSGQPRTKAKTAAKPKPTKTRSAKTGSAKTKSADKTRASRGRALLTEAQSAYIAGEYRRSRKLARRVLVSDPKNAHALQVFVASACQLGDRHTALGAYSRLPSATRVLVRRVCARRGIDLELPPTPRTIEVNSKPSQNPVAACRKDSDCVLLPEDPCSCPPCGRIQRQSVNRASYKKWIRRVRRQSCRPRQCPICSVTYLCGEAVCRQGACIFRAFRCPR
jgi:hypothetical protein